MSGALVLIPWHIGNRLDVTVRAARAARELSVFAAEEPEEARRAFAEDLGADCAGKTFLPLPGRRDARLLRKIRTALKRGDVGVICSGGVPCFADPGGWLVADLRARGIPVTALAGASALATMLSLSGFDWPREHARGTFVIHRRDRPGELRAAARRRTEPVFVLVAASDAAGCLDALSRAAPSRRVTAFFDLTKVPRSRYPYADRVITATARRWRVERARIPWTRVSDVALMVHPAESGR